MYVRDASEQRIAFVGTSLQGWRDIFSVNTGTLPLTVTLDGRPVLEGHHTEDGWSLTDLSFQPPYPTEIELAPYEPLTDAVRAVPVYGEGGALTGEVEAKLLELARDRRALFFGESHWNVGVQQLFQQFTGALLRGADLRTVALELNFSFSAHFDRFVRIADDAEAERFVAEQLHPMLHLPSTLAILEQLRLWNRDRPDVPVTVLCHDLEFDPGTTLEGVLRPYLNAGRAKVGVPSEQDYGSDPAAAIATLREALAAHDDLDHPFLTRAFVEQVLVNLADTANRGSGMQDRQTAIVRNLTEFHGAHLERGLTFFKVGGFHARTRQPEGDSAWREAAYLDSEYGPTKGRVAAISATGIGHRFGLAAQQDLAKRQRPAMNYSDLLRRYRLAVRHGDAAPDVAYRVERTALTPLEALAALAGAELDANVLWLERLDEDRLTAAGAEPRAFEVEMFVLVSDLEPLRPR